MDANKRTLEVAVVSYLEAHVGEIVPLASGAAVGGAAPVASTPSPRMSVEEFLDVTAAPGRMDDMRHAEAVYGYLELMLRAFKTDEQAEALCKGLHELGFWICLPHVAIERAYADRNIPDRYCTVALMAENRHLISVNEKLAEQVESLTEALRSAGGGSGSAAQQSLAY